MASEPTYSECEAALEKVIWEYVDERAVDEYGQSYPAGHRLTVRVIHVDAADVLSLVGEIMDYIGAHWPLSADPNLPPGVIVDISTTLERPK
jgi:hypothetical protein